MKKTIKATIKEVKEELDKHRELAMEERSVESDDDSYEELVFKDKVSHRMSKKSMAGNPENYFQFLKEILSMTHLDTENPILAFNSFPTTVESSTKVVKCHYLF